jgi:hypothetical protein
MDYDQNYVNWIQLKRTYSLSCHEDGGSKFLRDSAVFLSWWIATHASNFRNSAVET